MISLLGHHFHPSHTAHATSIRLRLHDAFLRYALGSARDHRVRNAVFRHWYHKLTRLLGAGGYGPRH